MTTTIGSLAVSLSLDANNFNGSIAKVDRSLKVMGSELKAVEAKGKKYGNSLDGLRSKKDILNRTLDTLAIKLTETRKKYDELVASGKANDKQQELAAKKVNDAQAAYNRLENELGQVNTQLEKQSLSWHQMSERLTTAGDKLQATGEKMQTIGKSLSTAVTLPIVGIGIAAVKTAVTFEAQMDKVGAIAGATAAEMEKMEHVALNLGANTSKSASEVSAGMGELAAMGFTVTEIIGAMPGVISAAEASGSDMAQTAEVMASSLNIFELKASDATKVADILAKTANISAASLTDMQYALKTAGPPAAALGISLEETSAAIGIMTNAGMKGEQAGTSLRGALLGLLDPSEENSKRMETMGVAITDNEGNFVGLSKVVENLTGSMEGQTDTQKAATLSALVGKEAVSGMLSLMKAGPNTIDKMTKSLEDSGGESEKTAKIMRDNLKGTLDELKGSLETAAITIGKALTPAIEEGSEKIKEMVDKFQELDPETQKSILKMAGLAAAIGPVVLVGGHLATSLGSIAKLASPLIPLVGKAGLAGSFAALANPIGLTVAGLGLLAVAVGVGVSAYKESNDVNLEAIEAKQREIDKNDELIEKYGALREQNLLTNEEMLRYLDIQAQLESTTAPEKIKALKDEQALLLEKSTLTNDQMNDFLGLNADIIETAPNTVKAISSEGEAFALNTIAIKELNAEKAKELEGAARTAVIKSLENEAGLIEKNNKLKAGRLDIEERTQKTIAEIDTMTKNIGAKEAEILELEKQKIGATLEQKVQLDGKIKREEESLMLLNDEKAGALDLLTTLGNHFTSKGESLEVTRKEIAAAEEARFKYEEIILAQAGINAEKGQGLIAIGTEIGRLEVAKTKLSEQLATGKINTAEYQAQNEKINDQISKLKIAKGELELINNTAGKTVYKDVIIRPYPERFWDTLDANLSRGVTKNVNIRYNNRNGPQEVGYATGTRYAPGGMSWVGEEGPELMYLPTGSRIVTNDDSQALLNKWNIPTQSRNSVGASQNQQKNSSQSQAMIVQLVTPSGRVWAEETFEIINDLIKRKDKVSSRFKGGGALV